MLTAQDIEIVVAEHFGVRRNVIVPNVSWGMWGLKYEADLVVLRPSGFAVEVEIKTTAADIRADLKKRYHHDSNYFRQLWFAVPEKLANHPDIPTRAGVLSIAMFAPNRRKWRSKTIRGAALNNEAIRWSDNQRICLMRLGCMRIWPMKTTLANRARQRRAE